MKSLITGQKIARRRPYLAIAPSLSSPRQIPSRGPLPRGTEPGLFSRALDIRSQSPQSSKKVPGKAKSADFFLLEGGTERISLELRGPLGFHRILHHRPRTGETGSVPHLASREKRRGRKTFSLFLSKNVDALLSLGKAFQKASRGKGKDEPKQASEGGVKAAGISLGNLSLSAGIALGLFILILGLVYLLKPPIFPLPPNGEFLYPETSVEEVLFAYVSPELAGNPEEEGFEAPPAPQTLEISTYKVRSGDTIGGIANRFGITIDSIVSMNGLKSAKSLIAGTELRIPNMNGLVHVVAKGENLGAIARRYGADMTSLADANDLGSSILKPGQSIFIPGAKLSQEALKRFYGTSVIWPLRGTISSWYGYRPDPFTGVRRFHAGIDIIGTPGTPVKAAMDGRVSDTGYNSVFGNFVILSHTDGLHTLYAHLSSISAKEGKSLSQGAVIGLVGSTGYSTGPHLHFGIFRGAAPINPTKMLK